MAGKNLFGVSVEEAMTRSGIVDEIVKVLSNMDEAQQKVLENASNNLEAYLKSIIALKEKVIAETRLTKEYLKKSQQLKRETSRVEYARKLSEQKLLLDSHKAKMNQYILSAFKIEHKILDIITGGKTETASYAIYFYGSKSGEIIRGEVSAKDLYKSDYIYVDDKGNLKLSAKIIKAESSFMKTISSLQDGSISTATYDRNLAADLEALTAETYSFLKSVQEKYSKIRAVATNRHLGLADDALHDVTRDITQNSNKIFSLIQEKTADMYNFFFLNQGSRPKGRINRGHLAEAYERLLYARLAGREAPSYYDALKQSLGNDPWYIAGDVGDTQVKAFFDKNDRAIASYSSIIALGQTLLGIIRSTKEAIQDIKMRGVQRLKDKESAKWLKADQELEERVRDEIENLLDLLKQ